MKTRVTTAVVAVAVAAIAAAMLRPGHFGGQVTAADVHVGSAAGAGVPAAAAGVSPSASATQADLRSPSSGKYLGVALPTGFAGLGAYDATVGTKPDIQEDFLNFGQPAPMSTVLRAYQDHMLTVLSWQPADTTLAAIAAGSQDRYISGFADQVGASPVPVAIDFAHEFNGNWMQWGAGGSQHATAAQFVAAWQRIHDLFTAAGATNVIWVWAPNIINPVSNVDLASYWPGAGYVDWIGLSAYWTGEDHEDSWPTLIGWTEDKLSHFTHDPIVITETGAEQGAHKAGWVSAMMAGFASDPKVIGLIYFDYGFKQQERADWTLEDDPGALAAWSTGAAAIPLVPVDGPPGAGASSGASGVAGDSKPAPSTSATR
jgi:mannan endo-1,4-beta-mannosidase